MESSRSGRISRRVGQIKVLDSDKSGNRVGHMNWESRAIDLNKKKCSQSKVGHKGFGRKVPDPDWAQVPD